jgi:quercetin dioxygenase-like cupin family protein
MSVEYRPSSGTAPSRSAIESALGREAREVHGWSNGPGDRYAEHDHPYTKVLYCITGSIDFVLGDGRRISLRPGDRLVLPPRTPHSAIVGPEGCACAEGKL